MAMPRETRKSIRSKYGWRSSDTTPQMRTAMRLPPEPEPPPAPAPGTPGTPGTPDPFAQYIQMAAFTTETVAINTDAVPADRFEVPADWKKIVPAPSKKGEDEFTCPKAGN
jgi:hypothetical protein